MKDRTKIMLGLLAGGISKKQAQEWIRELSNDAEEAAYKKGYDDGWEDALAHVKEMVK